MVLKPNSHGTRSGAQSCSGVLLGFLLFALLGFKEVNGGSWSIVGTARCFSHDEFGKLHGAP